MNFFTDIKFNRELTENEYCTITYSGSLFKNNSDLVSIVYGYGENWTHTREQKMTKTEEGFVVDIKLLENFDTFNFCFKNSYNQWDNNNSQNYSCPITKQLPNQSFIINENIISDILDNLLSVDLYKEEAKKPVSISNEENIEAFDIDLEENEPVNIEDSLVNSTEEKNLDNDIEVLFNDIYENNENNEKQELLNNILASNEVQKEETGENNFNMNSLINEILTPIVSSSVFDEEENFEDLLHTSPEKTSDDNNAIVTEIEKNDLSIDNIEAKEVEQVEDFSTTIQDDSNNKIKINDIEALDFKESAEDLQNDFELNKKINELISDLYKSVENSRVSLSTEENISENITTNEESSSDTDNDFYDEESLMDIFNISNDDSTDESKSLVEVKDNYIVSARSLSKFYLFKKKIKLAFCKIFYAIPRFINKNLNTNKEQD